MSPIETSSRLDNELGIRGLSLSAIGIDTAIIIYFRGEDEYVLRIERTFTIVRRDQITQRVNFDPFSEEMNAKPEGISVLAQCIGKLVVDAQVGDAGELSITFADGMLVRVEPLPKYEAWTLTGPKGVVVSLPKGKSSP